MSTSSHISVESVSRAFAALRRVGYIARGEARGFKCCGSCAGAAIANGVAGMAPEKRVKVRGAVTFHAQAADRAFKDGGDLYISYGPVSCHGVGQFGESRKAVGEALASALRAEGLSVEWDGDERNCVVVKAS